MADPPEPFVVPTADGHELAGCQWGDLDGAPVFWLHGTPGGRDALQRSPASKQAG